MLSMIAEIIRDLLIFVFAIAALLIALVVIVSYMPETNPLKRKHARPCEEKRSAPSAVPGWTSFIHPVSGVTPRFRVNHAVSARDDCL
jgi:hypothetical protein